MGKVFFQSFYVLTELGKVLSLLIKSVSKLIGCILNDSCDLLHLHYRSLQNHNHPHFQKEPLPSHALWVYLRSERSLLLGAKLGANWSLDGWEM